MIGFVSPKIILKLILGWTTLTTARLRKQRMGTENGPVSARNGIDAATSSLTRGVKVTCRGQLMPADIAPGGTYLMEKKSLTELGLLIFGGKI